MMTQAFVSSGQVSLCAATSCRTGRQAVASPLRPRLPHRMPIAAAFSSKQEQDGIVQFADSIGLPTDEGLFGFRPFAEQWVGRLAMMGFITSIVEEAITGKGTLAQIGLETPNTNLFIIIASLASVATLIATGKTLADARSGKLSKRDLARYRNFLGMTNEGANIQATQKAMKMEGDFLSPDNMAKIEATKREGTPADVFLAADNMAAVQQTAEELKKSDNVFALNDAAQADAAAAAMKQRENSGTQAGTSLSLAAEPEIRESLSAIPNDMQYARQVELDNGRWAMIGFFAAILVEAGTGNGIIMQIISYLKWSGILGPMSGF